MVGTLLHRSTNKVSANTVYYARIPKLTWEWIEVSALVAEDVWEKYPTASDVLHWTQYEELEDEK